MIFHTKNRRKGVFWVYDATKLSYLLSMLNNDAKSFFSDSSVGAFYHSLTISGSCWFTSCVLTHASPGWFPKPFYSPLVICLAALAVREEENVRTSPLVLLHQSSLVPSISANLCTSQGPCVCTLNWLMNSSLGWWALQGQTSIRQQEVDLKYNRNLLQLDTGCVSSVAWLRSLCDRFCAARTIFRMWKYIFIAISHICLHSAIVLHILWVGSVIKWISRMDTCLS